MNQTGVLAQIKWVANPFRGDRFEELWLPAAEAVLDYGATDWALLRAQDGMLDFTQWAMFETQADFESYWYSEEIADARAKVSGLHQVPLLPTFHRVAGMGSLSPLGGAAGKG